MADMNNEVVKLSEENNKLKRTEELRLRVATTRPQENKTFLLIMATTHQTM